MFAGGGEEEGGTETNFRQLTEELLDYFMEEQYELGTSFENMHVLYMRAFEEGLVSSATLADAAEYYISKGLWKEEGV